MSPISNSARDAKLRIFKASFVRDIDALAERLYDGRITLGMWEEDMRTRMRQYILGSAMIGKGDAAAMTQSDLGKVGAVLKKQYRWLHGFAQDIYDRRTTISLVAIKARAHLYAEAGNIMATEIQAGYFAPNVRRDPVAILPWIPGDGSTRCLNQCKCSWNLRVIEVHKRQGVKLVEAIWTLHPAEHCEDCIPRDGHIEHVEVAIELDIPSSIGLGGGL